MVPSEKLFIETRFDRNSVGIIVVQGIKIKQIPFKHTYARRTQKKKRLFPFTQWLIILVAAG